VKFVSLDFEYNKTAEPKLNLVCCSITIYPEKIKKNLWVHKKDYKPLRDYISSFKDRIFLSYNAVAEASAFISMDLEPTDFKWIDLFIEFRCLSNHNHKISCGKHLVDGKVINIIPPKPKWQRVEGEEKSKQLTHSLSQAVYKFLGIIIDTDRKTLMRDLIISTPDEFTKQEAAEIMEYCESDVEHLYPLYLKMVEAYHRHIPKSERKFLFDEMLLRGENAARAAKIERIGYPINVEATRNFANSVAFILSDMQRDINRQFPLSKPFKYQKKTGLYSMQTKVLKEWIKAQGFAEKWDKTDKNDISLSLKAWEKYFSYSHDFPEYNLGAQIVRYLKTKQNLNGFMPPKKDKKTFWDNLGSDGFVRPYLNIYGSQASRYQPSATSFLFLKSAWMRSLAEPPPGKAIVGIDFKSEEFFIKAITFLDKAMMKAYNTGDPYLAFAKDIKYVPAKATKKTHPIERQRSKSSILGIQYDMTKYGLSRKLTVDTGIEHSEDEAQEWINSFNEAYPDQFAGGKEYIQNYKEAGYAKLLDGWYMFGDNINDRSVGNFPHQGHGAVVLRKAIKYCQEAGLDVIIPLHDALYCLIDAFDFDKIDIMIDCLVRAFKDSFPLKYQKYANVFVDIEAWSGEYSEKEIITKNKNKVKLEKIHIDERSQNEYKRFSKYFLKPDYNLL